MRLIRTRFSNDGLLVRVYELRGYLGWAHVADVPPKRVKKFFNLLRRATVIGDAGVWRY